MLDPEDVVLKYAVEKIGERDHANKLLRRAKLEVLGRGSLSDISSDGGSYEASCQGSFPGVQYNVKVTLLDSCQPPVLTAAGPKASSCTCPYAQSGSPRLCKHVLALLMAISGQKGGASVQPETVHQPKHPTASPFPSCKVRQGQSEGESGAPAAAATAVAGSTAAATTAQVTDTGKRRLPMSWSRPKSEQKKEAEQIAPPPGPAPAQTADTKAHQEPSPKAVKRREPETQRAPKPAAPTRPWTNAKRTTQLGKREQRPPSSSAMITKEELMAVTDEDLVDACRALVAAEKGKQTRAKSFHAQNRHCTPPAEHQGQTSAEGSRCNRVQIQQQQPPADAQPIPDNSAVTGTLSLRSYASKRPRTLAELISGLDDEGDDDEDFKSDRPIHMTETAQVLTDAPDLPARSQSLTTSTWGAASELRTQLDGPGPRAESSATSQAANNAPHKKKMSFRTKMKGLL